MDQGLHSFIMNYFRTVMDGIEFKAIIATVLTALADFTGAHETVILLYMFLVTVDLLLGISVAVITKTFSCFKLYTFVRKIGVQLFFVLLFSALASMLFHTSGIYIAITNWMLLLYGLCECASSVEKLLLIGAPVPPVVLTLLGAVRNKVARKMALAFQDEKLAVEIEKAIGGQAGKEVGNEHKGQDMACHCDSRDTGDDVVPHKEHGARDRTVDNTTGGR